MPNNSDQTNDVNENSSEVLDVNLNSQILSANPRGFFLDLVLYLSVMFLVREIYFSQVGFIANGLFWSTTTLLVAMWRMKARNVSWKDLGLERPKDYRITVLATVVILALIPAFIIGFEFVKDFLPVELDPDTSNADAASKFGNLKGNWLLFFSIMPFVLIQSALEELLDRGFLINWIERTFSSTTAATVFAVLLQAAIFGFRHSYDLSSRSISVALIGLVMGIGYVAFGRNLWPLIIAHCILNTMSMAGRVQ